MAVSVVEVESRDRGHGYEVTLSASGDAWQAGMVPVTGEGPIAWQAMHGPDVSWEKSGASPSIEVSYTAGPLTDLAFGAGRAGVTGGYWRVSDRNDDNAAAEDFPLTGLRFKAGAADQKFLLWTRWRLDPQYVGEVTGV